MNASSVKKSQCPQISEGRSNDNEKSCVGKRDVILHGAKDTLRGTKKNVRTAIKNELLRKWQECAQCDYKTTRTSHLRRHTEAVHEGLKPYSCQKCNYKTAQAETLESILTQSITKRNSLSVNIVIFKRLQPEIVNSIQMLFMS